jgi:hypothetical protein
LEINSKEINMFINRYFRVFVILAVVVLSALVPQTLVFAGKSVDPATLNPPPPPGFNPSCEAIGSGTICHLAFSDPPIIAEPTGIICGSGASSFEVLLSQTRSVEGRRYYDRDGNLTQRHFREVFAGTFMNPLTNATVSFDQSDTVIHNLAVPGDGNTGTLTVTGSLRLHRQDGGVVLIDAGRSVLSPDGSILMEAGQHHFDDYFVFGDISALQPLCDALE